MKITFGAQCVTCSTRYDTTLVDPGATKRKGQILNRRVWMDNHYSNTRHHRFAVTETKEDEVSVAAIHDPNQLRLEDDENWSTVTLGQQT